MDDLKVIRAHIVRGATHIAREHAATDDVVWKQMLLAAAEKIGVNKFEVRIGETRNTVQQTHSVA